MGGGLCKQCYQSRWATENAKRIGRYKHEWYEASKSRVNYRDKSRRQKNGKAGVAMLANSMASCVTCGSKHDLTVHHKDHRGHNLPEKQRNNSYRNLQILCRKCHGKLHGMVKGWSRKHVACRDCGSKNRKHHAHGYCSGCSWKHSVKTSSR